MNKKYLLIIVTITIILIIGGVYYYKSGIDSATTEGKSPAVGLDENKVDDSTTKSKPPIVDHFACGDNCPGPKEKYMVRVYEGVTDPDECKKIGGKPASYIGWVKTEICMAE